MKILLVSVGRVKHRALPADRGQKRQNRGGIFHFVGIFVGMGFFRSSINLINTVLYKSNSIPIGATELTKTAFCELNIMELGKYWGDLVVLMI